ncbi:MAG: hypothetical protein WBO00_09945 [Steroidobacteraceae bacterium]
MTEDFRLVPCEEDGFPADFSLSLPEFARRACEMSALWIGYLSVVAGSAHHPAGEIREWQP